MFLIKHKDCDPYDKMADIRELNIEDRKGVSRGRESNRILGKIRRSEPGTLVGEGHGKIVDLGRNSIRF